MAELTQLIPVFIALIVTGVFAGLLAGLLGVGGGIVIVPVLYFVFQGFGVDPANAMMVATGTSLATIIPTSVSSIRAHHGKGNVDWPLLKRWAGFMIVGVLVGSFLVTKISGSFFSLLFAVLAILVSLNMIFRANAKPLAQHLPGSAGQGLMASCIGFFSVMVGIGGGTLGVPTLAACNYPAHRAVGTAAAFGLLIALPGALMMLVQGTTPADAPFGTFGLINAPGFLAIVPLTVLCAPIGASLGAKLDGALLKKIFAVVLGITGLRMLMQVLIG